MFALLPLPEGGWALSSSYIARSPFWLKNVRFLSCMFLSYVSCYPASCDILRLQRLCYLSWLYRKDFVSRQYRHHFATTLRSVLLCGKSTSCEDICSICGVNKPGIKRLTISSILSLPLTLIAHRPPFLPWFDLVVSSLSDLWEPGDRSFAQNG